MRLGILGGTFDPIHIGHLIIAEEARSQLGLERVLFIPAGQPRLKAEAPVASAQHRLEMVCLAVQGNPHFAVARNEVDRGGPTYTIDTLHELSRELGTAELYFVVGADTLRQFHCWRDPEHILELCKLVVVNRPGSQDLAVQEFFSRYPRAVNRVVVLVAPLIDISATDIRRRAAAGLSLRYLVPDAVADYIREHRLYLTSPGGLTPVLRGKDTPSPSEMERGLEGKVALDRLLELALELGALKYGDFTLSSGKKSSYYFDGRLLSLSPQGAHLIGQLLLPILRRAGAESVGGPTLGADPIVTAVAQASHLAGHPIPAFIVRKEVKAHGTAQGIEGPLVPGSRVAIADDTCTTGASLMQAIAAAEAAGCQVVKVLALLDRGEGGSDKLRRRGYDFEALLVATPEGKIRAVS